MYNFVVSFGGCLFFQPRGASGAYSLEVSHLRQSTRSIKWERPRLRDKNDSRGVTKQEAFCWILYCPSLATVSMQFAKGQTLSHLLLDIFTYWAVYAAAAEYSTRFSADGSDHRLFYLLLAASIFFMDVNFTGDVMAPGNFYARRMHLSSLAACYVLIGLMHARVAFWLPACRRFATFHLLLNLATVALYIGAANTRSDKHCEVLCWMACALFLPRTYGLPNQHLTDSITSQRNAQDYIGRSENIMVFTLALVVRCITVGVQPGHVHVGEESFCIVMSCLMLVLLVKLLLYDVHIADTKWHAVRDETSRWRPAAFLSLVPVSMAGVMMMASGSFLVLDQQFKDYGDAAAAASQKAGRSFGQGFGLMLLSVTVMRLLHNKPPASSARSTRRVMMMWRVQVCVQLLCAAFAVFVAGKISGKQGLYACVLATATLIVLNLMDEFEELHSHRSNWKVVRTLSKMHALTRAMKKGSQASDDLLGSQDGTPKGAMTDSPKDSPKHVLETDSPKDSPKHLLEDLPKV
ncbi:unnamed protein product [Symbiodinium natans]|uniref:Uncharacterized protein n=1 Tax=Symbiodinium natans TaxID=878477 RepID=A0A812KHX4_9DINO|nr:unnamed protein product [Symbiodinium natans]